MHVKPFRYQNQGCLHFINSGCYRRMKLLDSLLAKDTEAWIGRASRGLEVEQLRALCHRSEGAVGIESQWTARKRERLAVLKLASAAG